MQHERQQSCRYPAAPIAFFQQHFLYFFPEPEGPDKVPWLAGFRGD